jgi:hypothetical protein
MNIEFLFSLIVLVGGGLIYFFFPQSLKRGFKAKVRKDGEKTYYYTVGSGFGSICMLLFYCFFLFFLVFLVMFLLNNIFPIRLIDNISLSIFAGLAYFFGLYFLISIPLSLLYVKIVNNYFHLIIDSRNTQIECQNGFFNRFYFNWQDISQVNIGVYGKVPLYSNGLDSVTFLAKGHKVKLLRDTAGPDEFFNLLVKNVPKSLFVNK